MKLSTSTGDLLKYAPSLADAVRLFKDTPFRYINLEQDTADYFLCQSDAPWQHELERWAQAAEDSGLTYVFSHAPCMNAFSGDSTDYDVTIRAIRRSIESCGALHIPRIVVHASFSPDFTARQFTEQNRRFYGDLLPTAEKYGVELLTENMTDKNLYVPLATGRELREFVDAVDHPLLTACWDIAHAHLSTKAKNEGQYRCILDVGEKLHGLHIADNFGDGAHHHTFPFAGIINFDEVMQALLDVGYRGYFNFEASYTLLHHENLPYRRQPWQHNGQTVTRLLDPSLALKQQAVALLYETGKFILESYDCFEE